MTRKERHAQNGMVRTWTCAQKPLRYLRPSFTPCRFAASLPALVRSCIKDRSSSARTPTICHMAQPVCVSVSIASGRDLNLIPLPYQIVEQGTRSCLACRLKNARLLCVSSSVTFVVDSRFTSCEGGGKKSVTRSPISIGSSVYFIFLLIAFSSFSPIPGPDLIPQKGLCVILAFFQ